MAKRKDRFDKLSVDEKMKAIDRMKRLESVRARPLLPASFPSGPGWYVANTHNNREKRALAETIKLGFEAFLPVERYRAKINSRRTIEKEKPLFPQYLFVRFDINRAGWGLIAEEDSINRLLEVDRIPCSVPDDFVNGLRGAEELGLFDRTTAHLRTEVGDEFEILEGPFGEHIGAFIDAPSKQRIELLLEIFGRPTRVMFGIDQVRKI